MHEKVLLEALGKTENAVRGTPAQPTHVFQMHQRLDTAHNLERNNTCSFASGNSASSAMYTLFAAAMCSSLQFSLHQAGVITEPY